jgi:sialate O-acetylesterase
MFGSFLAMRSIQTRRGYALTFTLLLFSISAFPEVRLPAIFSDHMVVQRQRPVHVWGMADRAEAVSVSFRGETRNTVADYLGRWEVYLSPGEAGGPFELTLKGSNTLALQDVLVGDVWLASGQSNMEFPMSKVANAEAEIAGAKYPEIRLLLVEKNHSDYPLSDVVAAPWTECTPDSVQEFSAVAYFFGREIKQREKVPIGLIDATWGGTPAEAWTSLSALAADAGMMPVFAARAAFMKKQEVSLMTAADEDRQIDEATLAGKPVPVFPWRPDMDSWAPATVYNGMISPLTRYPIRGVIWYQGETNSRLALTPTVYERLFPTMIGDWRSAWGEGDFPFLYVQLANFTSTDLEDWAIIREAQRKTLKVRNTAMVVSIDIGDPADVHPTNKQEVGARLALAARAVAYGEAIEYSGPLVREVGLDGSALRVWFDHTTGGLQTRTGDVRGFEIAGEDGRFVPAQGKIDGTTVLVSSTSVRRPKRVRYGWANSPECNLYNGAQLPASPFEASLP